MNNIILESMNGRRLVELVIEEGSELHGVDAISLVAFPAIESNFIFFSKDGAPEQSRSMIALASIDESQRTLVGAALIPDKHIPRYDESLEEEYDVFFSKETVKQASELFLKQNKTNEHTFEHQTPVDGVSVVESWIVEDPEKDKSAFYGMSMPVGTWMVRVKVDNDDMWAQVKDENVRGFSVEGYFQDKIAELRKPKSMLRKLFNALWKRNFYAEARLKGGQVIATEEDSFSAGIAIFTINDEGEPTQIISGNYTTQSGIVFDVFDGILTEWDGQVQAVEEAAEVVEEEAVAVELDSMKVLYWKHYLKNEFARKYT
tara:strand:- start:700 stop:1650 length:951 start_codon:yes stop_codon:yes gene_type:complete